MECSILIVSHNTRRFTELCVKGAVKLSTASRVYVIDNGSSDGSLDFLARAASSGRLALLTRIAPRSAASHGSAIDMFIRKGITTDWLLLLDSDCLPMTHGFDRKLMEMASGYSVFGTQHFRDATLVHPSTMLIARDVIESPAGKVSFILKNRGGVITDTGMAFCSSVKSAGFRVLTISREAMSSFVKHRWCATRAEAARLAGNRNIDDKSLADFDKETESWLSDPMAQEVAKIEL
jgi:hypothetical protein